MIIYSYFIKTVFLCFYVKSVSAILLFLHLYIVLYIVMHFFSFCFDATK